MTEPLAAVQRDLCRRFGTGFDPPAAGSRVGIALDTLDREPINGLRLPAEGGANGWYNYAGHEPSAVNDFYAPPCVEHLPGFCKWVLPFLGLPAGWRFITARTGYEDVWFDQAILKRDRAS